MRIVTISPSLHTSMEVTVRMVVFTCAPEPRSWQNHGVRSDKMLLPSSYPHPVYNGKNKSTNAPLAPETSGSGYDIHMFFTVTITGMKIRLHLLRQLNTDILRKSLVQCIGKFFPGILDSVSNTATFPRACTPASVRLAPMVSIFSPSSSLKVSFKTP